MFCLHVCMCSEMSRAPRLLKHSSIFTLHLVFGWLPVLSRGFRAPGSRELILAFTSFTGALGLTSLSLYPLTLTTIFMLLK